MQLVIGVNDVPAIRGLLQQLVSGYQPSGEVADWVSLRLDIRWKQRFDNFQRAFHQFTHAVELKAQRPLSDLENRG